MSKDAASSDQLALAALRQARLLLTERLNEIDRLNTELLAAKKGAEAALLAKAQFLATMSHEIRTPLNAIIGLAGILGDSRLEEEQRDYVNIIRNSGDHLLTVINDILDYSKLESGKLLLENIAFSVITLIEDSLDLVAAQAREKNLELTYELAPDVPVSVLGDAGRVRQILTNYLANAVKFTEHGEVVVSVSSIGQNSPVVDGRCGLHFAVRDTGLGIPADRFESLFQSFSQVDASTQRKFGGTGLGLAICKRLAANMGGQVGVESTLGKGSVFHFTIQAELPPEGTRVVWQSAAPPSLVGLRVWVVDDNDTNRRILRKQVESWGMIVRDTALPAEALRWARQGDPCDLVLLDYLMPELDGLGLAQELRILRGEGLKQLLLSSIGPVVKDLNATGLAAQLTKPIKRAQLLEVILRLLERRPAPSPAPAKIPIPVNVAPNNPLRILVAEDNAVNIKVISRLLERLGYRPDVAANGIEAVAAVRRQPYDVVLMDVQMPELDGIAATRQICQEWEVAQRPSIIALTAGVLPEERQACLDAGMSEFLNKPIKPSELADALARYRRKDAVRSG